MSGGGRDPATRRMVAELLASIRRHAGVEVREEDFGTDLVELGVSSLVALEIAIDLEEALEIIIDERDLPQFRSVARIVEIYETKYR